MGIHKVSYEGHTPTLETSYKMYSSTSNTMPNSGTGSSLNGLDIDLIANAPPKPELSRQICLQDYKSLQSFLKLSRYAIDDNLQSILYGTLNHNETKDASIYKFIKPANKSEEAACTSVLNTLIYPEWRKRSEVIEYCKDELDSVANGRSIIDDGGFSALSPEEKNEMLRVDPYTYKDLERKNMQANAQVLELQQLYSNEELVENIVINRSKELLNDVCHMKADIVQEGFTRYARDLTR